MVAGHDSPEPFIAFEQPVERLQLAQIFRREWPPFALPNEPSEPFAQASSLNRDIVELSRHGLCPQRLERFGRHELRLLQPDRQTVVDEKAFRPNEAPGGDGKKGLEITIHPLLD